VFLTLAAMISFAFRTKTTPMGGGSDQKGSLVAPRNIRFPLQSIRIRVGLFMEIGDVVLT